jgi:formylglycine-generating enzyme required for sulfatase activity
VAKERSVDDGSGRELCKTKVRFVSVLSCAAVPLFSSSQRFIDTRRRLRRMGTPLVPLPAIAVLLVFALLWLVPAVQLQAAAKTFRDCKDCPLMTTIPAGRFRMGAPHDEPGRQDNEATPHWTAIARPFALGVYDVTRADYARFVDATGHAPRNPRCDWHRPVFRGVSLEQTSDEPVVCVSWSDADAYVRWLSAKAGRAYRLPTETEWEYAARAGSTTARPWGPEADPQRANTALAEGAEPANAKKRWPYTSPVGSFPPNRFGLFDMLGNVWQWTVDCGADADAAKPSEPCENHVVRGGGWFHPPEVARSAARAADATDFRVTDIGFRVARSL